MSGYETFHLRSPDVQTFLSDAKAALESIGIDPYKKGLLQKDSEGNDLPGQGVDVILPNRWYITEPTYDTDGNQTDPGEKGNYALINIRVKDKDIKEFIKSFNASNAKKSPSEIPNEEKIGNGTHRIKGNTIDSPVRIFATK